MQDVRPDGFIHVWDYPDDPDEPCWTEAAEEAIKYVAFLLQLDPELDFKIECQTVDWREELKTNFVGSNYVLINAERLASSEVKLTTENIGFIIDGFQAGYMAAHTKPSTERKPMAANVNWDGLAAMLGVPVSEVLDVKLPLMDVHTEHCCLTHGCKYGDTDCTVTTTKGTQSYPCEQCEYDE